METTPHFIYSLFFLILFLIGVFSLTAFNVLILKLGKFQTKETLKSLVFLWKNFLLNGSWEKFYILVSVTKHLLYLLYAISAFFFLLMIFPTVEIKHSSYIFLFALIIVFFFLVLDFFVRLITRNSGRKALKFLAFISSLYILVFLVFTSIFWTLSIYILKRFKKEDEKKKPIVV
nr:hypothetical protein [Candidatus Anoxychlamydiales bacterium]